MSGGLDSTTLAFKALSEGFDILPVNINYGQKNIVELKAFQNIMDYLKNQPLYKNSVLDPIILDAESFLKPVISNWQKQRDTGKIKENTQMEFYTPSRNLLFTAIASMVGEIIALNKYTNIKVGIGIHKHKTYDRNYWDITPQFAKTFDALLALNDCAEIEIFAPYVNKFKSEIVKDVLKMNVPWKLTWTCYDPIITKLKDIEPDSSSKHFKATPCLKCEACKERQESGRVNDFLNINNYELFLTEDEMNGKL
jgi:7-cyano-7-deazaguanine synthase